MSLEGITVSDVESAVQLLHQAIALLTPRESPPDLSLSVSDATAVSEEIPRVRTQRGRKIAFSQSELVRVYNEHRENRGEAPTKAVIDAFTVDGVKPSRSWANKRVREAREQGLLLDRPLGGRPRSRRGSSTRSKSPTAS